MIYEYFLPLCWLPFHFLEFFLKHRKFVCFFLLLLVLLESYLRHHCLTQGHDILCLCFLLWVLWFLALIDDLIQRELIFIPMYVEWGRGPFPSSACGDPLAPACLLLFPRWLVLAALSRCLSVRVYVYFCPLSSIPLIYVSHLLPIGPWLLRPGSPEEQVPSGQKWFGFWEFPLALWAQDLPQHLAWQFFIISSFFSAFKMTS